MQEKSRPASESGFDPFVLVRTVRKHLLMALVITVAVSTVTVFYALGQKRIFRSTATILIDPNPPKALGKDSQVIDLSSYWTNQEYQETQFRIITSRKVAAAAALRLGLHKDPTFLADVPPGTALEPREVPLDVAAGALQARLSVEREKKTRLVRVSVEDSDPERARRLAGAVVETYVEQNLEELAVASSSAAEWLRTQMGNLKGDLENSEVALHNYKKEKNILSLSLDDRGNMLRAEMEQLNTRVTEVRLSRERLIARLQALAAINSDDPDSLPTSELLTSVLLQSLRDALVQAKRDFDVVIAEGRGANHPEARAITAKIESARAALLREVAAIRDGIKKDLGALDREVSGLTGLYEQAKSEALDLNLLEIEYKRLERLKVNNEKLYELVLERSKESDLSNLQQVNNIRLVEAPLAGGLVRPNVPMMIVVGIGFGVLLGIAAAFGREQLDRTIKSPEQVESELGLAFLGLLPSTLEGGRENGSYGRRNRSGQEEPFSGSMELYVHERASSALAEAARAVRTNILFMDPDRPCRSLLITSPGPSEGKTTVACWLATAMAQAGQNVLLIDCDLRRPRIHRIFQRPNDFGMTMAMMNPDQLDPESLRTEIPNLSVLTAGPHVPNPAELLGSSRFKVLLGELLKRYDRVIVDSPPVAPVTDAAVLAVQTDGILLVLRSLATSRELARRSVRVLEDVGGRIVGAVLNDVTAGRPGYGYGYKYSPYYYRPDYSSTEGQDA